MSTAVEVPRSVLPKLSWIHTAIVTISAALAYTHADAAETALAAVSLTSFAIGFVVWIVAFGQALGRTTRGDDIAVSNWVFLSGSVAEPPRRQLLGSAALVFVVTIACTAASPFVWLANLLPLALSALYGARHGTFPQRRLPPAARGGGRDGRRSQ